jgi:uncharacterized protein (TIGR02611 family)
MAPEDDHLGDPSGFRPVPEEGRVHVSLESVERVSSPASSSASPASSAASSSADAATDGPSTTDTATDDSPPDTTADGPSTTDTPTDGPPPDTTADSPSTTDTEPSTAADDPPMTDVESPKPQRWRRLRAGGRYVRNRVYALPGGRTIFRMGIAVLGGLIVVGGLVLVPLPGPGWAIVFGGLAIWAIEFAWAARLLNWVRRQVRRFTQMMLKLHWTLRAAISVAGVALLLSIAWLWIKHRYGFETVGQFWDYITTH